MRRLTVLLFRGEGPGEDEYIGCVGNYGSDWRSAPGIYERLNVVDEATHERLVEALRDCEEVLSYVARKSGLTHSDAEGVAIEARNLLAALEAEKGGEL